MVCSKCHCDNLPESTYCGNCTQPLRDPAVAVSVGDGNSGSVIYGNRNTVTIGQASPDAPTYEVEKAWATPLTQARLAWISLALGLVSLLSGYFTFEPVVTAVRDGGLLAVSNISSEPWLWVMIGALILFALVMTGYRVTKAQSVYAGWWWLPKISGWGHRLQLVKLAGDCTRCGGKLVFHSEPDPRYLNADGKSTRRWQVARCRDNREHWWQLDATA